ncbi:hypothetical protein [Amycolatopsis sp. 195334CR]|uniref:hypothetical protein n=1 Tax=Amycolatopsis sp. 195334CR TaxID=2814588 RepID=UPI001A8F192B|nr:hypothetical protein [Amycolatopsis sp. 195334CR]MBN6041050.1 hypothetical protein [Amycolatopsis sp. 195334CR]
MTDHEEDALARRDRALGRREERIFAQDRELAAERPHWYEALAARQRRAHRHALEQRAVSERLRVSNQETIDGARAAIQRSHRRLDRAEAALAESNRRIGRDQAEINREMARSARLAANDPGYGEEAAPEDLP